MIPDAVVLKTNPVPVAYFVVFVALQAVVALRFVLTVAVVVLKAGVVAAVHIAVCPSLPEKSRMLHGKEIKCGDSSQHAAHCRT